MSKKNDKDKQPSLIGPEVGSYWVEASNPFGAVLCVESNDGSLVTLVAGDETTVEAAVPSFFTIFEKPRCRVKEAILYRYQLSDAELIEMGRRQSTLLDEIDQEEANKKASAKEYDKRIATLQQQMQELRPIIQTGKRDRTDLCFIEFDLPTKKRLCYRVEPDQSSGPLVATLPMTQQDGQIVLDFEQDYKNRAEEAKVKEESDEGAMERRAIFGPDHFQSDD